MKVQAVRTGIVAALLLLCMSTAWAGSPRSMSFDGVQIRLGQSFDQAVKQLHGTFDLQPAAGQPGAYTVQSKGRDGKMLGIVTFQNGQVVRLERERGAVFDIGQGKIMTMLTGELVKENNTRADISLEKIFRNGVTQEIITLKLPGKRILITISDSPSGSGQISFREILE